MSFSKESVKKIFAPEFNYFNLLDQIKMQTFNNITNGIKVRYGEEIILYDNDATMLSRWIAKYDSKFENRPHSTDGQLSDCQFIFKLDDNTFCFIQSGSYVNSLNINNFFGRYSGRNSENGYIKAYVFGKKYKKYIKELKENQMKNKYDLYIYDVKGASSNNEEFGIDSVGRVMTKRDINTLFFNDHVKESVCDHIDNFLVNKSIYESKNLTYKTGILLYGDPGTGKSSLAIALATKYNYNVIVIDMGTFNKLNISTLTTCINADTDKYIILLEDIDTLFDTLNREDNLDKDEKTVLNKMLQFLDSSSSPNDVIFIATTNHIEKLDDAIKRDGRFDIKINIGNIDRATAREMVKSFQIDESEVDGIIDECDLHKDNTVNPAELQNKILSYFKGSVNLKEDLIPSNNNNNTNDEDDEEEENE